MDIVCHAFPAWDGNYFKSTVALMEQLAKRGNRVLYVDYAYTWKDLLLAIFGKGKAPWKRILGLQPRMRNISLENNTHIQVLSLPPVLPANFIRNSKLYHWVIQWNSRKIGRSIRQVMQQQNINNPLVINAFNPAYGLELAGKLQEKALIYYCYDNIAAASWAGRHGARAEAAFVPHCDLVLVSSSGLQEKMQALHDKVVLIKNGVDIDLFSTPVVAEDLPVIQPQKNDQKVVGYLGSIDNRLNYSLLERLFVSFPEVFFLFVGRVQNESIRSKLAAFPNVLLTGPKPVQDLPGWVQKMDVGLIPFIKNEFTAAIYPLKINEYLAAGKAVVSTNFANLSDFTDVVSIADNADTFEAALRQALIPDNRKSAIRAIFAQSNSWASRTEILEKHLTQLLIP